jgi:D-inositol-3-phosphate glycosyltransferase
MKLAVVDPLGGHGGFQYYVDGLARGLQSAGVEVSVFVSAHTAISGIEPYRITQTFGTLFSDEPKWKRGLRFLVGMTRSLLKARLTGFRFVNFHVFHYEWMEAHATILARLVGLKIILTIHDIESFGGRSTELLRNLILSNADAFIVHNDFSLEALQRTAELKGRPVRVVPHGHYGLVYPEPPDKASARRRIDLDPDVFTFLFFGNSRLEKGLDLLIEAVAGLPVASRFLLLTAGKMKPDQSAYYQNLAQRCGIADRIRMDARLISEEEAPDYFAAADLVVVPYRRIYESGVTIMAQTLAAPVLVSDLPPLLSSIEDGACGYYFAAGDVLALRTALAQAMETRDALPELGRRGRERVLAARDWNKIGGMTRELLEELAAK